MILVTVELVPASGGPKRHLGTAKIVNDGTGSAAVGNYRFELSKWGQPGWGLPSRVWRRGQIEGFPRKKLGPWDLLCRALAACVGDRNG